MTPDLNLLLWNAMREICGDRSRSAVPGCAELADIARLGITVAPTLGEAEPSPRLQYTRDESALGIGTHGLKQLAKQVPLSALFQRSCHRYIACASIPRRTSRYQARPDSGLTGGDLQTTHFRKMLRMVAFKD